ncbi:S-layer homology domain-containing protein [Lysinibacillus fusiformis]|uniref:S-layer homology domain-containing protein n=1 Tax=Lysinibacillus fusiformis TaxID=28031 RepID=UPI00380CAC78
MRKKIASIVSLMPLVVSMGLIFIFSNKDIAFANIVSTPIYASEDTTMIYEGIHAGLVYEDGNLGYLDVGYQGVYGVPLEVQVLLKFQLPPIPVGYRVETANLYIPVTGGTLQAAINFSLKISTSTKHNWTQDTGISSPPAPTSGSIQTRLLAHNVPILKPTLAPFNFTSYISEEFTKADPRATFILSGMTAQEAAQAGIPNSDHFIQMTENHAHDGSQGPYLIITYSEIANIEITGVVDGGLYNTDVTPQFNVGTATLNGNPFTSGTLVSAEGFYTLTVTAGSQSEMIQFRIDKTPPTGMIIVNQGNQYTNSVGIPVLVTPDVGINDVTHIQYSVNGQSYTQIPYVPSFMLSIGPVNEDKILTFKLVDGAGNESLEYQRIITLDTVAPSGTVVINNGNTHAANREVTLNLTLGNGVTDVVGVQYSSNNSNWTLDEAFSSTKTYTLPAGDGNKTVYVRLIDRAGNITVIQDSIVLDTTAPIVSGVVNGASYNMERTITFNEGTATLNGHQFVSGTSVDTEGSYTLIVTDAAGNSTTMTFTIVKTAPSKYTVLYDGNRATGGQVPVNSQTYENGHSVTVADNSGKLVKTGFTFNGWNTKADGSGINYMVNTKFIINASDVTLYALWKINRYTLSFESNGGSVVAIQNISYNGTTTEPIAPTKQGYTFGGWFKEVTLNNSWDFTKDTVIRNTTLYAKWIEINSTGGSGGHIPTPETNPNPKPTPTPEIPVKPEIPSEPEIPVQPIPTITFSDISTHWAKEMIEYMAPHGIINGYPDGTFRPDDSIQRQHVAIIFSRAFELVPRREAIPFNDVAPSHPYYEEIMKLQQAKIIDGSNGSFHPSESLTRAQMAKIIVLAFGLTPKGTSHFEDVSTTHWAHDYIATLEDHGVAQGDNGSFRPNEPVTRAQFVAFLYRALHL